VFFVNLVSLCLFFFYFVSEKLVSLILLRVLCGEIFLRYCKWVFEIHLTDILPSRIIKRDYNEDFQSDSVILSWEVSEFMS
jgi:hypothetical protein